MRRRCFIAFTLGGGCDIFIGSVGDVLEAVLWGLIQGVTEFLPVSSSGHLRLAPEAMGAAPPDLTASAVLHLGTLLAVIVYYRRDIAWLIRGIAGRGEAAARRTALVVAAATVPAVLAGLAAGEILDRFQESATAVGAALTANGLILWLGSRRRRKPSAGEGRRVEETGGRDAVAVGLAQAAALLPGVSRSGMVITMGQRLGLAPRQAARLAFLMSVPVIAGAGLWEMMNLSGSGEWGWGLAAGVAAAALSGYAAIALLIRTIARWGLRPFAIYCVAAGLLSLILL